MYLSLTHRTLLACCRVVPEYIKRQCGQVTPAEPPYLHSLVSIALQHSRFFIDRLCQACIQADCLFIYLNYMNVAQELLRNVLPWDAPSIQPAPQGPFQVWPEDVASHPQDGASLLVVCICTHIRRGVRCERCVDVL